MPVMHSPFSPPRVKIFLSLDLGQSNDRAALGILFRTVRQLPDFDPVGFCYPERARFDLRQLIRFQSGTSYPDVVSRVFEVLEKLSVQFPAHDVELLFDRTGVGRAVGDLLRACPLWRRPARSGAGNYRLVPVTVTGGDNLGVKDGGLTVPKRDLVAATVVLFQSVQLSIAERLPEREVLISELVNFRQRTSAAGFDSYGNDGKLSKHDDCVTVLSLAAWGAQRDRKKCGYVSQPLPNSF